MKKILLIIIGILASINFASASEISGLDKMAQPHLSVVSYNELLESIKHYSLQAVSIYDDPDLYRKWSNIVASIGIFVVLILLFLIISAIIQKSQDNLKKDIAILVLLVMVSTLFTPFFSFIGSKMSGDEKFYDYSNTDGTKKDAYTRIYIPSNKAIVVQPTYINEKGETVKMETDGNLLAKRSTVFDNEPKNIYSSDYLGIPAKVFQTQWSSKDDPTDRYSKAFYSVDVDELFKGMTWPIKNLQKDLGFEQCTIQFGRLNSKKEGSPLSFFEALGKKDLELIYDGLKKDTSGKGIIPFTIGGKEISSTSEDKIQVVVPKEKCNLGLYFLSNEYFSTYNQDVGEMTWENISGKMLGQDYLSFQYSNKFSTIFNSLDYQQQKRARYIQKAIINLSNTTLLDDSKLSSNEDLKNIQLACGRIITDNVQDNEDFKICLKGDAAGDTTMYTKDTTSKLGLSGKNKDINSGYVFPVPQSADWSFPLYYKIETNLTGLVSATIKTAAWWGPALLDSMSKLQEKAAQPIYFVLDNTLGKLISGIKSYVDSLKPWQLYKEIRYATSQDKRNIDDDYWSPVGQNPQLASFESYDLNGDGIMDYDQNSYFNYSNKTSQLNYFNGYHFSTNIDGYNSIDLESRNVNYLQTPIYKSEKIKGTKYEEVLGDLKDEEGKSFGDSNQVFTNLVNGNVTLISKDDFEDEKITLKKYNNEVYLPIIYSNQGYATSDNLVDGGDLYLSDGKIGDTEYFYDSNNLLPKKIKTQVSGQYDLFLNEDLGINYFTDSKMIEKKSLLDDYELEFNGYVVATKNALQAGIKYKGSTPQGEYFFKASAGYNYCENETDARTFSNSSTMGLCPIVNSIGTGTTLKTIEEYVNGKEVNGTAEVYRLFNIYKKNGDKKSLVGSNYIEGSNKLNEVSSLDGLFLPESASSYQTTTNSYFYKRISDGKNFIIPITHYKNVKRLLGKTSDISKVSTNTTGNVTLSKCTLDKCKEQIGSVEELQLKRVDFNQLGREYKTTKARILLNPNYNLPITYTPANQYYLPEYEKIKQICLINQNKSNLNSNNFDKVLDKNGKEIIDVSNCSKIGDQNRITDIRLQTYIKTENYFNSSSNSKSFTHVFIPLSTNGYIENFTSDRREQNYAGEANKDTSELLSFQKIEGVKISEGDVIVLKPGVVLGAFDFPYTIMVPTKLLPYIKFVRLDNHSETVPMSKEYTNGIYSWLTSFITTFKDGEASKFLFGDATKITEAQKYTNFLFDKYDSRPDALKSIEGVVPDRYFHSYYGSAYFTESEASSNDSVTTSIATFFLNIVNYILKFRTSVLELLYLVGPFLVFFVLIKPLRKIFTFAVSLIIGLLIFPIIVLFLVNLISL